MDALDDFVMVGEVCTLSTNPYLDTVVFEPVSLVGPGVSVLLEALKRGFQFFE